MNHLYCDAVNQQQKADSESMPEDVKMYQHRAKMKSDEAKRWLTFISVLDSIAAEEHQFSKLKITT
jgi:hypothetical protein